MIAVYDSGIGGMSVLRALRAQDPHSDILYLADQARCPYGERDAADIERIALGCARWLMHKGASPIVVACNTASAMALDSLRLTFPQVPFVGMVPAVKPAVALTQSGVVGVMATAATLKGRLLRDVTARYAQQTTVVGQACHGLVDFVEAGDLDSPALKARIREHIQPLLVAGADVIVLGCTHYPFLQDAIQAAAPHVTLIDPAPAVARQALAVAEHGVAQPGATPQGQTWYFTTGSADYFAWQLQALGLPQGPVQSVTLEELQ